MASFHHHHSDMDRALDGLAFSYLDGVPFRIDPRIEAVNKYDLSKTEALLARPLPSSCTSGASQQLLVNMGRLEKQVLCQLKTLEDEKLAKKVREEQEEKEYQARKEKEKLDLEAANNEVEAAKEEDSTSESKSSSSPEQEKPNSDTLTPLQLDPVQPVVQVNSGAAASNNFNFSEFEAETDPFDKAELQTINDMQELAAVLQTTSGNTACQQTFVTSNPQQNSTSYNPQQFPYYNNHQQPYYYRQGQYQRQQVEQQMPVPYFPPYKEQQQEASTSTSNVVNSETSSLKSSKSVGDIMNEIQREAEAMEQMKLREQRKVSSQTPPPRVANLSQTQRKNVLDDWIPWPDLDPKPAESKKEEEQESSVLDNLSQKNRKTCRQISDMGFPLERVAKVCEKLGDDQQQIVNYCLMVAKLSEEEKFPVKEVEEALLLHNVNEENARKHLKAYQQLADIGFDSSSIHKALVECQLDYSKALEQLLK